MWSPGCSPELLLSEQFFQIFLAEITNVTRHSKKTSFSAITEKLAFRNWLFAILAHCACTKLGCVNALLDMPTCAHDSPWNEKVFFFREILRAHNPLKVTKESPRVLQGAAQRGCNITSNNFLRAACLQNETAPEKLLNRYEKRFEKREKRSEKRSETCLKNV